MSAEEPLLPLADAIEAVVSRVPPPRVGRVPLARAAGLVLAADVASDLDMPPFEKAMMDGYALRSADLADLPAELRVIETIAAGALPAKKVGAGEASKIMTGAPMPAGADAVVAVERTEALPGERVSIRDSAHPGKNVSPRGQDVREGDVVLRRGRRVGPAEIAVLAAVGAVEPSVFLPPRVAVLTTGDELVPPGAKPGPGRIRNSNSAGLVARLTRDGAAPRDLGIVPDDLDATRAAVREAMAAHDVVVLTGGVSMGDYDLVGRALLDEGFSQVFHRIRLKPGKPVLFGTGPECLVFGLPGNPVSVSTTYELLVRPAVRKLLGHARIRRPRVTATLETETPRAIPREQYLPARLRYVDGRPLVSRRDWHGSADLFGAAGAGAMLVVPAGGPPPYRGGPAEVLVVDEELGAMIEDAADA